VGRVSLAIQAAYAGLLLWARAVALWGALRVRRVRYLEVRRGLFTLLVLAILRVMTEFGRVLVGPSALAVVGYVIGLVVGLAAVGAWLYCAAAVSTASHVLAG
jgi:uncharacterized protein YqgC (DUF456 family)